MAGMSGGFEAAKKKWILRKTQSVRQSRNLAQRSTNVSAPAEIKKCYAVNVDILPKLEHLIRLIEMGSYWPNLWIMQTYRQLCLFRDLD